MQTPASVRIRPAWFLPVLAFLAWGCAARVPVPPYPEFLAARRGAVPDTVLEVYGRIAAKSSGKSVRASLNLLMDPGKSAYLEILDPSGQLRFAYGMSRSEFTLLWAREQEYVREEATPQNLMAITGFPLSSDDLMLLIAGYGLNFPEWKETRSRQDGWDLARFPFNAALELKKQISRITVTSPDSPPLRISYSDYVMMNNRLTPRSIHLEVPDRKISLRLTIDKLLPRDEPADPGLFEVQIPPDASRRPLREVYSGKPLIYSF